MSHCEDDVIALAALGEPILSTDAEHLADCGSCRVEVDKLSRVVAGVRVELPAGPPIAPPARVWDAILAETSGRTASAARALASVPTTLQPTTLQPTTLQPTTPRSRRRAGRRLQWPMVAVAASALVVGAAGGSLVTHLAGREPTPTVVARTALAGLPLAPTASGQAEIVQTTTGPVLDVDVSALGATPGQFYEVWLIDRKIQKMVAVGILRGATGEFTLPAGLNLHDYPIVDVSVQQPGDPRHSGKSVLRGTVDA